MRWCSTLELIRSGGTLDPASYRWTGQILLRGQTPRMPTCSEIFIHSLTPPSYQSPISTRSIIMIFGTSEIVRSCFNQENVDIWNLLLKSVIKMRVVKLDKILIRSKTLNQRLSVILPKNKRFLISKDFIEIRMISLQVSMIKLKDRCSIDVLLLAIVIYFDGWLDRWASYIIKLLVNLILMNVP